MAYSSARHLVFLSGSRDVAHILAQAYEVIDRVGTQKGTSLKRAIPYYWEFAEEQDRQTVQLLDLPRATDPTVSAVVFVFGGRLGAPIPSEQDLPVGFRLPAFIDFKDHESGSVQLTYTAFEFLDWQAENERRKGNGEPLIPGFVFYQLRLGDITDGEDIRQRQWLAQFFRHYFGPNADPLHGLKLFQQLDAETDLSTVLFQALAQEFDVPVQIPWRQALRGLQRYEVDDRHVYFGRETEVDEVARRLLAVDANMSQRILLVDGPSGVGKSSFVRAGIAGSARDNRFHNNGFVACGCLTPYELYSGGEGEPDPGAVLADAITNTFSQVEDQHLSLTPPDSEGWGVDNLAQLVAGLISAERNARAEFRLSDARSTFVFVLDQSEQVLDAIARSDAGARFWTTFLALLLELVERGALRLLFALASDRVEEWQRLPVWAAPLPRLSLACLNAEATEVVFRKIAKLCAVSKPVTQLDAFLNQAKNLIDAQMHDASAVLPLLSNALFDLFETIETKEHSFPDGLPDGHLIDAIENTFNQALNSLHERDQLSAARSILPRLVALDPGSGQRQLLVAERNDFDQGIATTLWDNLVRMRLLTDLEYGRARLVHETVLDHWSIACDWLGEEEKLIAAFARFRAEAPKQKTDTPPPNTDRQGVEHAVQLLGKRDALLDTQDDPETLRRFLRGVIRRNYAPEMDRELDDAKSGIAAQCIEADLEDVIFTSVDATGGDIQHLETGKYSVLYVSALRGDYALCAKFLSLGCNPNEPGSSGWYPIHIAANETRLDLIKLFISHGADPAAKGPNGQSMLGVYLVNASIKNLKTLLDQLTQDSDFDLTGDASLMSAVVRGDLAIVQELVARGWDLNYCDEHGTCLLSRAAMNGHLRVLEHLLSLNLDPFQADNAGRTAFHYATHGNLDCLARLCQGIEPTRLAAIAQPWTLLVQAVEADNTEIIDYLAKFGAIDRSNPGLRALVDLTIEKRNFYTTSSLFRALAGILEVENLQYQALMNAVERNDRPLADALSQQSSVLVSRTEDKKSPLHAAVSKAHYEIADILIGHGADPVARDEFGNTALHLAAQGGDLRTVQLLLAHSRDVDDRNVRGETALCLAVQNMHSVVILELLKIGADLTLADNKLATPLHYAASSGAVVAAGLILTRTNVPDLRDVEGRTPLFYAAECGQSRIVRLLLDYNASLNASDNNQTTPLAVASRNGHLEAVELLLRGRPEGEAVDPNQCDKFGWTPLHLAVWSSHALVLRTLIDYGADLNLHTKAPILSPVQIASEIGAAESLRLLLANGAGTDPGHTDKPPALQLAIRYQNFECAYVLLRHGVPTDGAHITAIAKKTWEKLRQQLPEFQGFEALVYNDFIERGVLSHEYRRASTNPQNLALFERLMNSSTDPWAMPAMMPGDWSSIGSRAAAAKIIAAANATRVEESIIERIDGMREMELSCLWPITTIIECRLKTDDSRAESLVFLSAKHGFIRLTGKERPHSLPGFKVMSTGEEYLRMFLATLRLPDSGDVLGVLDPAQTRLHANAIDAADLQACREDVVEFRFSTGTLDSATTIVVNCVTRAATSIFDVEFHLTPDGVVAMKSDKEIRKVPRRFYETFEDGLRVIRTLEETDLTA